MSNTPIVSSSQHLSVAERPQHGGLAGHAREQVAEVLGHGPQLATRPVGQDPERILKRPGFLQTVQPRLKEPDEAPVRWEVVEPWRHRRYPSTHQGR